MGIVPFCHSLSILRKESLSDDDLLHRLYQIRHKLLRIYQYTLKHSNSGALEL